jgi:hypothetical protein
MKKLLLNICKAGVMGAVVLIISGCMTEAARNTENAKNLRIGMTKAQVLKIMGEPVKEEFATPDRWFYFVESSWADGLTTENECMPLVFEKGKLIGWGNRFYAQWRLRKNEFEVKGKK